MANMVRPLRPKGPNTYSEFSTARKGGLGPEKNSAISILGMDFVRALSGRGRQVMVRGLGDGSFTERKR